MLCYGQQQALRSFGAQCPIVCARQPSPKASLQRGRCVATRVAQNENAVNTAQFSAARRTLSAAIDEAVKREDYGTAAQLKREMDLINADDPFYQLNQRLEDCIREQRFQDAAKLKAELKELESLLGPQSVDSDTNLQTTSDTLTCDVRVKIVSMYRPAESAPHLGQYFFSYHVIISNESDKVVQLRRRRWIIRDASGKTEEVSGPGVVGVQPILLPGNSYEYSSACPLRTPAGTMEGEYEMWVLSEDDGQFKDQFEAKVGRFKLTSEGTIKKGNA